MFTPCIYQGYMFKNLAFVNIWAVKPPAKVNLHGVNSKSALHLPAPLKKPYIYKLSAFYRSGDDTHISKFVYQNYISGIDYFGEDEDIDFHD